MSSEEEIERLADDLQHVTTAVVEIQNTLIELLIALARPNVPTRAWVYERVESIAKHCEALGYQPIFSHTDIERWKESAF